MESDSKTLPETNAVPDPALNPAPETGAPELPLETPAGPKPPGAIRENIASLIATAVLALFFTTFLTQAFEIPSESMEDTLLAGDRPFGNKLSFSPSSKC